MKDFNMRAYIDIINESNKVEESKWVKGFSALGKLGKGQAKAEINSPAFQAAIKNARLGKPVNTQILKPKVKKTHGYGNDKRIEVIGTHSSGAPITRVVPDPNTIETPSLIMKRYKADKKHGHGIVPNPEIDDGPVSPLIKQWLDAGKNKK
jgi:hypothetical protein